jgi:hypothetical protein
LSSWKYERAAAYTHLPAAWHFWARPVMLLDCEDSGCAVRHVLVQLLTA